MTVVNFVRMEDYIKGVVSAEMTESWPLEALKAQAIAARTYAARNLGGYSQYGFDVTGTASSQAYGGTAAVGSNIAAAVEATAGLYLTYGGALCATLYFSSDGGGTEDSENVFTSALPYLRGVLDPYEEAAADINKYSSWTRSWTRDSIRSKITALGYSFGTLAEILPTYSDTGNVIKIAFEDTEGRTVTFSAGSRYAFCYYSARLNLPSIHFTVQISATNPDVYVFSGSGWGHNVGMSQFGAYAMAKYYGKTYDQILAFYYTGAGLSRGVTAA
jgi:stage II sporulation protein D